MIISVYTCIGHHQTHVVHLFGRSLGLHRTGEGTFLEFLYHVWNFCLLELFVLDLFCWFDLYTNINIRPAEVILCQIPPKYCIYIK